MLVSAKDLRRYGVGIMRAIADGKVKPLDPKPSKYWRIEPDWVGETGWIIGGGTSARGFDFSRLRGRIIAINDSYLDVPQADFLMFSDPRWWRAHRSDPAIQNFRGQIISLINPKTEDDPRFLRLMTLPPPGLVSPVAVARRSTTSTAALDFMAQKGCVRIGMIGFDGKKDEAGKTHRYAPHPDAAVPQWKEHAKDFALMAPRLRDLGVEVIVANPESIYSVFNRENIDALLDRWS